MHSWPGGVLHHSLSALRRRPERGPDRVPDQLGALPPHTLPPRVLRPRHLRREGLPRTGTGGRSGLDCHLIDSLASNSAFPSSYILVQWIPVIVNLWGPLTAVHYIRDSL